MALQFSDPGLIVTSAVACMESALSPYECPPSAPVSFQVSKGSGLGG